MKRKPSIRSVVFALLWMLIGAIAGGGIVYNRVALRYERRYEQNCLVEIYGDIFLAKKIRNGGATNVLKRYEIYLGGMASALPKEIKHVTGLSHALWSIKHYYREYQVPTSPELENLFRQIPDEEPSETMAIVRD